MKLQQFREDVKICLKGVHRKKAHRKCLVCEARLEKIPARNMFCGDKCYRDYNRSKDRLKKKLQNKTYIQMAARAVASAETLNEFIITFAELFNEIEK